MFAEALLVCRFQISCGNNLVGVDIIHFKRREPRREILKFRYSHRDYDVSKSACERTSSICPSTAARAAIAGDIRNVRAPLPCRPMKFLFEVEAQYLPDGTVSPFIAMHMLHPGSRHSHPAERKTSCRPSFSALIFTSCEPATTKPVIPFAILRPFIILAAIRRSSMRELVQLPMKTKSTGCPIIFCPPVSPMYSNAPAISSLSPFGTVPVTGADMPGFVPQVTIGSIVSPSITTSLSKAAPSSDFQLNHLFIVSSLSLSLSNFTRLER